MSTPKFDYSAALSILCQGFVLVQEKGMDKPQIFTCEWWKGTFCNETEILEKVRSELGDPPPPVVSLINWFDKGIGDPPPEALSGWVKRTELWLRDGLSKV